MVDYESLIVGTVAIGLVLALVTFAWVTHKLSSTQQVKEVIQPKLTPAAERDGIGNGYIELTDDCERKFLLFGGAYRSKPEGMIGVKMAAEINKACNIDIPTRDFSTPDMGLFKEGLDLALGAMEREGEIYVGCMGGFGRTGLFITCFYTMWNLKYHPEVMTELRTHGSRRLLRNMLEEVRARYCPHAVETDAQFEFCVDYVSGEMIGKL